MRKKAVGFALALLLVSASAYLLYLFVSAFPDEDKYLSRALGEPKVLYSGSTTFIVAVHSPCLGREIHLNLTLDVLGAGVMLVESRFGIAPTFTFEGDLGISFYFYSNTQTYPALLKDISPVGVAGAGEGGINVTFSLSLFDSQLNRTYTALLVVRASASRVMGALEDSSFAPEVKVSVSIGIVPDEEWRSDVEFLHRDKKVYFYPVVKGRVTGDKGFSEKLLTEVQPKTGMVTLKIKEFYCREIGEEYSERYGASFLYLLYLVVLQVFWIVVAPLLVEKSNISYLDYLSSI